MLPQKVYFFIKGVGDFPNREVNFGFYGSGFALKAPTRFWGTWIVGSSDGVESYLLHRKDKAITSWAIVGGCDVTGGRLVALFHLAARGLHARMRSMLSVLYRW